MLRNIRFHSLNFQKMKRIWAIPLFYAKRALVHRRKKMQRQ